MLFYFPSSIKTLLWLRSLRLFDIKSFSLSRAVHFIEHYASIPHQNISCWHQAECTHHGNPSSTAVCSVSRQKYRSEVSPHGTVACLSLPRICVSVLQRISRSAAIITHRRGSHPDTLIMRSMDETEGEITASETGWWNPPTARICQ